MHVLSLDQLELAESWSDEDPSMRHRGDYPVFWGTGAAASSVVVFELDPGRRLGRHTHSAEEVVVVLEGDVEVTVGDERSSLSAPGMGVVPPLTSHDVRNTGDGRVRCVGFFPSAAVVTVFEAPLEPGGSRVEGTPPPEGVLSED